MWSTCLYAQERTELVQKMPKAPLLDGSRGLVALSDCSAGEAGRRWCRWGTAGVHGWQCGLEETGLARMPVEVVEVDVTSAEKKF